MELWEKEYLEAIQQKRHGQKPIRLRISKYWIEEIGPDGSKRYIPKRNALKKLQKQSKKRCRRPKISTNQEKITLVILTLLIAILFVVPSIRTHQIFQNSSLYTPLGFNKFQVCNSYVNGVGLKNMATTLWDIRDRQTNKLNMFVANRDSFSTDDINAWHDSISKDLIILKTFPYDDSYSELIEKYVALLSQLQDYICYETVENKEMAFAAYNNYLSLYSELNQIFIEALENNRVKYTLDEKGLSFIYYNY